jgi:hypothetical protein
VYAVAPVHINELEDVFELMELTVCGGSYWNKVKYPGTVGDGKPKPPLPSKNDVDVACAPINIINLPAMYAIHHPFGLCMTNIFSGYP